MQAPAGVVTGGVVAATSLTTSAVMLVLSLPGLFFVQDLLIPLMFLWPYPFLLCIQKLVDPGAAMS